MSPDSRLLAYATETKTSVLNLATSAMVAEFPGPARCLSWNPASTGFTYAQRLEHGHTLYYFDVSSRRSTAIAASPKADYVGPGGRTAYGEMECGAWVAANAVVFNSFKGPMPPNTWTGNWGALYDGGYGWSEWSRFIGQRGYETLRANTTTIARIRGKDIETSTVPGGCRVLGVSHDRSQFLVARLDSKVVSLVASFDSCQTQQGRPIEVTSLIGGFDHTLNIIDGAIAERRLAFAKDAPYIYRMETNHEGGVAYFLRPEDCCAVTEQSRLIGLVRLRKHRYWLFAERIGNSIDGVAIQAREHIEVADLRSLNSLEERRWTLLSSREPVERTVVRTFGSPDTWWRVLAWLPDQR